MKKRILCCFLTSLLLLPLGLGLGACQAPEVPPADKPSDVPPAPSDEPTTPTEQPSTPYTVYVINDIRSPFAQYNNEDYNDTVRFYTCLQGRLNKDAKRNGFYVYQKYDSTDAFWLEYLMSDGKMLDGCSLLVLSTWDELWDAFGDYVMKAGIVIWDPWVPSTANVASTVCSVDGYLPVRYDEDENSLYSYLLGKGVPVKLDLLDKFTGKLGTKIPDTDIDSTGSIKCDPYLWALELYMDRTNPSMLAYTLDGASTVASNAIYKKSAVGTTPNCNQLYSHDYYIYNECFFIDLTCVADELPCDDPWQPMGTDAKTLATILSTMQERNNGNMTKLMGFPPWYMKYTTFNQNGKTEPVALEWAFTKFITQYDFLKEADAWSPSWMTNASVYCQYESTQNGYVNNVSGAKEKYESNVRYFTVYMGDYDSSAWLKEMVPRLFTDDARGTLPLMWAFNPNLSDRVPMIFDYVYENKSELDFFITGDCGAGYVFPTELKDIDKWIEFCEPYMDKFDMDIVGFLISDKPLSVRELEAYSGISLGSVVNNGPDYLTVFNDESVYIREMDVYPTRDADTFARDMYYWMNTLHEDVNFAAFRTIKETPSTIAAMVEEFIAYANAQKDGYTYKYVDMYTLFDLVLASGQGLHLYSK